MPDKPVELTLYEIMMISGNGMTNRNTDQNQKADRCFMPSDCTLNDRE
ncbi:MAG TPA: hypothetical protein V6D26_02545 [Stenomitos sp.]